MRYRWLVYWLYDPTVVSGRDETAWATHGYIGATKETRFYARLNQHRRRARFPENFSYAIILEASQKEALAYEAKLRPRPYIGWNLGIGGFSKGGGLKGIPKSPEHREKQRQAALRRWSDKAARERQSIDVKKGLRDADRTGKNNANFGKKTSEATKQKIRQRIIERGGVTGKNNPNWRHGRYT